MMNNSSGTTAATDLSPFNTSSGNIAAAFFVAVLMLLTLTGNIMVCACFFRYRELRTICNYFIISLSVADILVALLAMPFWLVFQLTDMDEKSKTIFSKKLYVFWASVDILVGSASIMNLVAVSFDRYLAITSPFTYTQSMTSSHAIVMIAALWIFSIVLCGVRAAVTEQNALIYMLFLLVVSFVVPLLLMIVMYMKIYFVARNQAHRIRQNYVKDMKATKTIAIVIGAFVVCWMPFFVIVTVFAFDPLYPVEIPAYKAIKWMEYLNSCLNPIIYTCLNRSYRRSFKKLLVQSSCCPQKDSINNCTHSTQVPLHKIKTDSPSQSSSSTSEGGLNCVKRSKATVVNKNAQRSSV